MATRLVQLTHADGTIWSAPGWDQAGRRSLAKVTRPYAGSDPEGGLVFSEELRHDVRDAVSAVIWAHGRSGVDVSEAQTYGFDDAGRLKEYTQGLWSAATGTVTGSPTARHDYTLDEQSNWREHQGRSGSARLSPSVSTINAYTNWPTDIDGNGTAEFKNPDPGDENRSIDGQLGFVWKKEERELASGSKRTMKHVHDGLGRLVEVLKDGVSQVRYGYTADGRLAWRREVAAGRTVWYVHDGTQVIQEIQTAPSAVLVQEYCWQETTLLETRKPGSWIRTLHQDRLGSVVAATAGGGGTVTIEARTAYDPYGRPVSLPSWSAAGVEAIVPFGYTGARWEDLAALDVDVDADGTVESVGLYAMGARWYDAEMGRFLEQDPLGEVAGSNLYAYVDASPVMWVDPSGLTRQYPSVLGYQRPASWRPESLALHTELRLELASSSRVGDRTLVDATTSTVGLASKSLSGLGERSAAARQVAGIASAGAAPLGIWAPWEDPPALEPRIDPLGPPCVRCFQVEGGTAEEQLKLKETLEKLRRSLTPQTIDYFRTTYGVDINEILTDGKGPVLNIVHSKGPKIAEYDRRANEINFNIDYFTFGANNAQFDEKGAMRTALHESEHYANDVASWFGDLDPPYDVRMAGRILNEVGPDAYWDPLRRGGHDGKPYGWIAVMIQFGSVRR